MKNLVEFLSESISKLNLEEIEDNFYNWLDMNCESDWNAEDLRNFAYDNIADFADEYDLTDNELDELTHPKNDKAVSFDKWIEDAIENWGLK